MKKMLLLSLVALLVLGVTGVSYASVDRYYESAVVDMQGDVKVDTKGDGTWVTPWIGMKLMKGAKIKTGAGSWVDIVYDAEGLNILRIKEKTEMTVQAAQADLARGEVFGTFANLGGGSKFVVKTPTAACGIRGSIFGVGFDDMTQVTSVVALEHSVFVTGLDAQGNEVTKEVAIPQGFKSQVKAGNPPAAPTELSANEIAVYDAIVAAIAGDTTTGGGDDDDQGDDDDDDDDDPDPKDLDDEKEVSPSS